MTGPEVGGGTAKGARLPRRVVVVGCGRLGSLLAGRLSGAGCEVVIVDLKEETFERLSPEFAGTRVSGDATELAVLKEAGIEKAGCVLAITQDDNVNLLVAEVARTLFQVPRVLVRVFDPNREALYADAGLQAISPTDLAAAAFLRALGQEEAP